MGKSKLANGKSAKDANPLTSVKSAGVTKASSTPVAKSKKMAKEVALKAVNGKSKKSKKVESEDESSESDSSEEEEEEDDDDEDDSSDEEEEEKPAPKSKTNGKAAAPAPKTNGKAKAADSDEEEESDSDEEEDSDDSDDEVEKPKAAVTNGKKSEAKAESSDEEEDDDDEDEDDDDEDSSDDDDDEEEEEKKPEPSKKRKAEEEVSTPFKKTKAEDDAPVTLFVGNLGWAVDDDKLYEAFKDCADIVSARVVTDKAMQRSRGFGYVDFSNAEACQAALEKMQGFELEGRAMNLDPSKPKPADSATPNQRANDRAQRHGDTVSQESDTIFVGNLPWDADEEVVTAFFSEVAEIKSVRLPTDRETGERKGFGYVSFNSVEEAKSAFESKNGAYIGEGRGARAVRLDFAAQRPPREGGDFGGGGGGGFGGRGGGRGGRGGGRGGFGDRGGRGGGRGGGGGGFGGRGGGRGGPRGGGFGSRGGGFQGKKITF